MLFRSHRYFVAQVSLCVQTWLRHMLQRMIESLRRRHVSIVCTWRFVVVAAAVDYAAVNNSEKNVIDHCYRDVILNLLSCLVCWNIHLTNRSESTAHITIITISRFRCNSGWLSLFQFSLEEAITWSITGQVGHFVHGGRLCIGAQYSVPTWWLSCWNSKHFSQLCRTWIWLWSWYPGYPSSWIHLVADIHGKILVTSMQCNMKCRHCSGIYSCFTRWRSSRAHC